MSARSTTREVWVGLIVIGALAGLIGLVGMASKGPGFLAAQQTLNVVFRDGQGIRIGSSVRVAGLDTGTVEDVRLAEVKGERGLRRRRVAISLPSDVVKSLRQDVKVSIVPALTGMSHVNVLSIGKSEVALVPGQEITGVESSFFDPIFEQVGLGPVERNHLSHMIAEVRETVDSIGPRIRQMLGALQETTGNLREMSESIRPSVESTVAQVDDLARKLNSNSPRIQSIIVRTDELAAEAQKYMIENRDNVKGTIASSRDFLAMVNNILVKDSPKVEGLLDGVEVSRKRADRVLYQADKIMEQASGVLMSSRAEIERSVTNVRDATDMANRTMQKIYANPASLAPWGRPSRQDQAVQAAFDTALAFTKGAQELHDTVKTIEIMAARPSSPQQQEELLQVQQRLRVLTNQMNDTATRLSESLSRSGANIRRQ